MLVRGESWKNKILYEKIIKYLLLQPNIRVIPKNWKHPLIKKFFKEKNSYNKYSLELDRNLENYVLLCLILDGYLVYKKHCASKIRKYFDICCKLNFDCIELICSRIYASSKEIINKNKFFDYFKLYILDVDRFFIYR